ncbi:MAG: putative ABC transporter ATP-binding protein [Methanomassiliicoccales archaeon PtaU1.Bin030]|nr:MAG: putative ABC transporter ATP-binding protein [Methanomassiliicoccales archaeon PtaU1.Bin030]
MEPAIEIRNLSKEYVIASSKGYYQAGGRLGEKLASVVRHPLRTVQHVRQPKETFWALRDINYTMQKGESVGIIGRNGAGKSTLLKILSQITCPTEGEVVLRGTVGSLLEVGTGFHPDLTGRENIFLNGAILGMHKKQIEARFDEIVKFAEVEKFLDTPIKRFSSGMYLRLAFAVAAHLEPDILIADEVLAIGDQQFQAKCLGKMREVSQEGRTVIFVSHNMHAVKTLCQNAILLQGGRMLKSGPSEEVISEYASSLEGHNGNFPVTTKDITIWDMDVRQGGVGTMLIDGGRPFDIHVRFQLHERMQHLRMGIFVNNSLGDELIRTLFSDWDTSLEDLGPGTYLASLTFPGKLLVPGNYTLVLGAHRQGGFDMLVGHRVEAGINVSAPNDFNSGGGADPLQAQVILDRRWDVRRE